MTVEDNKRFLQRFVQEAIDGKNLAALPKYLSPNFFHHDLAPGEQTSNQTGIAGLSAFFQKTVFPGLSDFKTSFADMIGDKDLVAGRWSQSVRQTGPWLGRPPSNATAAVGGISIVRVRDNLIVEEWEARDTLQLLAAFGVMQKPRLQDPPPARPAQSGVTVPLSRVLTGGPLAIPSAAAARTIPAVAPVPVASPSDLKAPALTFVTGILNDGKLSLTNGLLTSDFVDHDVLDGQQPGADGVLQFVNHFRTAFPDVTVTPDVSLSENDKVVIRWTATGTQKGTFLGIPASGRPISVAGINMCSIFFFSPALS